MSVKDKVAFAKRSDQTAKDFFSQDVNDLEKEF